MIHTSIDWLTTVFSSLIISGIHKGLFESYRCYSKSYTPKGGFVGYRPGIHLILTGVYAYDKDRTTLLSKKHKPKLRFFVNIRVEPENSSSS